MLLLTLIYGIGNLNFYGISYSFDMQGLGFGYNSIIAGCVEMVSFTFLSTILINLRLCSQCAAKKTRDFRILRFGGGDWIGILVPMGQQQCCGWHSVVGRFQDLFEYIFFITQPFLTLWLPACRQKHSQSKFSRLLPGSLRLSACTELFWLPWSWTCQTRLESTPLLWFRFASISPFGRHSSWKKLWSERQSKPRKRPIHWLTLWSRKILRESTKSTKSMDHSQVQP